MAHWWENTPWRMVQTNLREPDMADIDASKYARDLKDFGATVVNLNAAGIIASYDTKLDFQPRSEYLHGDSLRGIVDECHKQGLRVIARTDFARIRRTVYMRHPDWAARLVDGGIIDYNGYVSVCPNSAYHDKYMFDILRELFASHPFDGLFCNMSGFFLTDYDGKFYGMCQCETCRRKYREQTGSEVPSAPDPKDPAYRAYAAFQAQCGALHKEKLKAFLKQIDPELALGGVDFIRSESNTDYGRPGWIYSASSNARLGAGPRRARPSDNASVDFIGFRHRDISVSPALMGLRQWQNFANSGCTSLYVMGRLDNHRDTSGFGPTRRVFQFFAEHESLFMGLKSAANTVLLRTGDWHRADEETQGWIRILTESHVPFDEVSLGDLKEPGQLAKKKLLILPDLHALPQRQTELIDGFARAGGTVLATGEAAALPCLGVAGIREVRCGLRSSMFEITQPERQSFPRCAQTPYIDFGTQLAVAAPGAGAKTYLRLVPEHPFGPPECCYFTQTEEVSGLLVNPYGNGQGIYLPWKAGALYQQEGYANPLAFLQDVLFSFCGLPVLAPDLTPMVELVLCQKDDKLVVQLINGTGCFANSYFAPVPVRNIRLVLPGAAGAVTALNGGKAAGEQRDGALHVTLDVLDEYEAIVIG